MRARQEYIQENLAYLQGLITENKNFSVVKVGDGEIDCMQNKNGINIDNHPYSLDLGEKLKMAYIQLVNKNVFICDWFYSNPPINSRDELNLRYYDSFIIKNNLNPNFIRPFELLMLGWGNLELPYLFNFYQIIKNSNRNKIYVGPQRISDIIHLLKLNSFLEIPLINAFASHEEILNNIKTVITDDSIILLSVGLQSPVISNELLNFNPNITILDIGSGFDPLYYAQTRGGAQASVTEAKNYFSNL